uniref:Syntaxin-6_N domain-containing protein n=1 Tax=Macrostomum lignano TaxID=282301 RepID=A0A1I8F8L9_9PLAT
MSRRHRQELRRDSDLAFSLDNLSLLVEDVKRRIRRGDEAAVQQSSIQDEEFQRRLNGTEAATSQRWSTSDGCQSDAAVLTRVESLELHQREAGKVRLIGWIGFSRSSRESWRSSRLMESESGRLPDTAALKSLQLSDSSQSGQRPARHLHAIPVSMATITFLPASCCDSQGPTLRHVGWPEKNFEDVAGSGGSAGHGAARSLTVDSMLNIGSEMR